MRNKIILSSLICVITGIFLLGSCAKETDGEKNVSPDEVDVTVSVKLPGTYSSGTRALSDDDENAVNTIEVLVFEKDGTFVYTAYGRDITTVSGNQKTFDVTLRTGVYDIMILANSREELNKAISQGDIKAGATWTAVEKSLVSAGSGKWNSNPGTSGYKYLPMSGYLKAATIHESASTISGIKLLRTHAKTNIILSTAAQADFKLKSVNLYNYMEDGQIAPTSANMNSGNNGVTAPSIPASAAKKLGPLVWDDGSITTSGGKGSTNDIYMFEAPAGSRIGYQTNTCLVIGGEWKGTTYYYRIDYVKDNGGISEYLPILRNHLYLVTINQISGPGYPTPHSAFESLPYNIDAQIEPWNEEDIDVHDDGQYQHSLRPVNIELWADGASGMKIDFRTTYPNWSYEKSDRDEPGHSQANPSNVSWLSVTSHTAGNSYTGNGNENEVMFNVAGNYTVSTPRTAYLHFNAGKFNGTVTVKQYNYYIESIGLETEGEIPPAGESRTVYITGLFEKIEVRARGVVGGSYTVIAEGTVTGNKNSASKYVTGLYIPSTAVDRTVSFEYLDPRYNEWRTIRTEKQPLVQYVFETYIVNYTQDYMSTRDTDFTIAIYGNFPKIKYRVSEINTILGTAEINAGTAPQLSPTTVNISTGSKLPDADRHIGFAYSTDDGVTWNAVVMLFQLAENQNYSVKTSHNNGEDIPSQGASYTVSVTGSFPQIMLRAAVDGTASISTGTTIDAGNADANAPVTSSIFVPSNSSNATRLVYLQYSVDGGTNWQSLSMGYQKPVEQFKVEFNHVNGDPINPEGQIYRLILTGTYPTIFIRTAGDGADLDKFYITAGTSTVVRDIEVEANRTLADRNVQFQYSTDGYNWVTVSSGKQPYLRVDNYVLKETSGRIVAMKDLESPENWATAMGVSSDYLNTLYPHSNDQDYNTSYHPNNGGCAAYSEPGYPAGTWRVPTSIELWEMLKNYSVIGMKIGPLPNTEFYWNCRQDGTYGGLVYVSSARDPNGNSMTNKMSKYNVRCVATK